MHVTGISTTKKKLFHLSPSWHYNEKYCHCEHPEVLQDSEQTLESPHKKCDLPSG